MRKPGTCALSRPRLRCNLMTAFENSSFHETKVGLEFGIIKKNKLIIIIIKENSKDIQYIQRSNS